MTALGHESVSALRKLQDKEKVNVVYMGGSITEGGTASEYSKCWAAIVGEYLKGKYGVKVSNYNAGVSGTGSGLGVFRLDRDVLSYEPDVIFIEFAINDLDEIDGNKGKILIDMEGIVRFLHQFNPDISIIFLYTASKQFRNSSEIHRVIAEYYNIPSVDLQELVKGEISKGAYVWEDLFRDTVHPNDKGYGLYANYICECLEKEPERYFGTRLPNKKPLLNYAFNHPRMLSWKRAESKGNWQEAILNQPGKIESIIYGNIPGDSLEVEFLGKCFGLYYCVSTDGGRLDCIIDGIIPAAIEMYDDYSMVSLSRFQIINLDEGLHKAKLTISSDKNPKSTGNMVRIGYILVD